MGDLETFANYMPSGVDAEAIYNILAEPSKEEELMEMLYGLISEQIDVHEHKSKYQRKIAKGHSRSKKRLIGKGGNKDTGGGKGHTRPSMKRSKSAPAGFGAIGEVEELEEETISTDTNLTKDVAIPATSVNTKLMKDVPGAAGDLSMADIKNKLGIGKVPGGQGTGLKFNIGDATVGAGATGTSVGAGFSISFEEAKRNVKCRRSRRRYWRYFRPCW